MTGRGTLVLGVAASGPALPADSAATGHYDQRGLAIDDRHGAIVDRLSSGNPDRITASLDPNAAGWPLAHVAARSAAGLVHAVAQSAGASARAAA